MPEAEATEVPPRLYGWMHRLPLLFAGDNRSSSLGRRKHVCGQLSTKRGLTELGNLHVWRSKSAPNDFFCNVFAASERQCRTRRSASLRCHYVR